jgi:hypothetical protein
MCEAPLALRGRMLREGNIRCEGECFARATGVARVLRTRVASNEGLRRFVMKRFYSFTNLIAFNVLLLFFIWIK